MSNKEFLEKCPEAVVVAAFRYALRSHEYHMIRSVVTFLKRVWLILSSTSRGMIEVELARRIDKEGRTRSCGFCTVWEDDDYSVWIRLLEFIRGSRI